jgi:hypothetical protein
MAADPEAQRAKGKYNILTMDGGGIRGMIGCMVIKHIEEESYKYAVSKNYKTLPAYAAKHKKLHVTDLFDMLAGTSTGSIMTGLLGVPTKKGSKEARYFINETINLYKHNGTQLFKSSILNNAWSLAIGITAALILGSAIYFYCRHALENKKTYNDLRKAQLRADGLYYKYEEVEEMEDLDGDGIPDALQLNNPDDSGEDSDLDHFEACRDVWYRCRLRFGGIVNDKKKDETKG